MSWPVLFLVIVCFLFIDVVLLRSLVLCGLYLVSLMGCLLVIQELGYKATRFFDSGWIDYFGGQVFLYMCVYALGKASLLCCF